MRLAISLISLGLLGISEPTISATLNVPGDHATIQAALNVSTSGDIILVGPGTYAENLLILASQNGVKLESTAGATSTIIDGTNSGRGVIIGSGVGSTTEIRGFTIRNGAGGFNPGGGMLILSASPKVINCIFEQNSAAAGGAVYADVASPTFEGCVFRDNHAPFGSGGGLYADNGGLMTLSYCLIYDNDCAAYGGGVTAWVNSIVRLDHCTVAANAATLGGSNLYFRRGGSFQSTASIIALPASGNNIEAFQAPGTSTFTCSDIYVASGVNTQGFTDPVGSSGNFSLDPQFCDIGAGQLGLTTTSPCTSGANTNGCGQVGARDAECGVVSTQKQSWGRIKSTYR